MSDKLTVACECFCFDAEQGGCIRTSHFCALQQQKPTVTKTALGKVHDFIMSGEWGPGMFLEWLEQSGMTITRK